MPIQYASCPLDCFDGCRFKVQLQNDRITKIEGDPEHPVTAGFICAKGRNHLTRLYSAERIINPLVRDDGVLKPISMDNALNLMADRIHQVVNEYGSTAIMHYSGSGSSGLLHDLGLRFFNALGGVTLTEGSICWGSGLTAQKLDFGQPKAHSWDDLINSKLIVLWGRDPHTTNQHLWPYIEKARQKGARLMVVNPLLTSASKHADLVLRPHPGSDGILALTMAQIIISEGLIAHSFIEQFTTGYEEFYTLAHNISFDEAVISTGLTEAEIRMAAQLYASCQPASILFGYGLQRYANGGHTVRYIDALAALTGNLGVAGGGANYANQVWGKDLNDITGATLAKTERRLPMSSLATAMMSTTDPPLQMVN
ncbi:MAG: molybdopterin-dependent oxidoreductase, partial [Methylocystaceae bacterium]